MPLCSARGSTTKQAVNAYDALVSFARGFNQRHAKRPDRAATFDPLSGMRGLSADEFPHVVKLAGRLVTRDPEKHFDDGLALVLGGIEDQIEAKR